MILLFLLAATADLTLDLSLLLIVAADGMAARFGRMSRLIFCSPAGGRRRERAF